nr:hypothetical protein Iba_chr08fCG2640 [Ipomoea batatas]
MDIIVAISISMLTLVGEISDSLSVCFDGHHKDQQPDDGGVALLDFPDDVLEFSRPPLILCRSGLKEESHREVVWLDCFIPGTFQNGIRFAIFAVWFTVGTAYRRLGMVGEVKKSSTPSSSHGGDADLPDRSCRAAIWKSRTTSVPCSTLPVIHWLLADNSDRRSCELEKR